MKNIAMLCPYFGKFPNNILLTFSSMSRNKNIDWFIFTDQEQEKIKYDNIKFIKMPYS